MDRTPMNGIIGMTVLTLESELTRQQRENLMIVSSLASSLLTIIDDILDISKSESVVTELETQADQYSRGWSDDNGANPILATTRGILGSQDTMRQGVAEQAGLDFRH